MAKVIMFFVFLIPGVMPAQVRAELETLVTGKFSCRALAVDQNRVWYAASGGKTGYFDFRTNTTFEKRILFDTLKPDFRSIAQTTENLFVINAGSPALLYKINKKTMKANLVYRDADPAVFFDSMVFLDDLHGVAVGDPAGGCFQLLTTDDGGTTWKKSDCANSPPAVEGEAAFAASNSCLISSGGIIWLASGGHRARIFQSADMGKGWVASNTPITEGKSMTGIFSCDFYDVKTGFIVGGNYDEPDRKTQNKAVTSDGGKSWALVADGLAFGYASCVRFVPQGNGAELVTVGKSGIWYSSDTGKTWIRLSDDGDFHTIRFLDHNIAFAAGVDKIVRIRLIR